jgi:PAS domain S-box-containing protein
VTQAFAAIGGNLDAALENLRIPAFIVGRDNRVVWLNSRAREVFGDVIGQSSLEALAPESRDAAKLAFTKKMLGTERASTHERWMRTRDGTRILAEVHTVAIDNERHVVGVFGVALPRADVRPPPPLPRRGLTPRQLEVLHLLAHALSTAQIADELGIEQNTVRNHIRGILRMLGVHSRLEAVVEAGRRGLLVD